MPETIEGHDSAPSGDPPKAVRNKDLSSEIERGVAREPNDRVRCVRVFDDFYRCNWWTPSASSSGKQPSFEWMTCSTHYVRESRFLHARLEEGSMVLTEVELRQSE